MSSHLERLFTVEPDPFAQFTTESTLHYLKYTICLAQLQLQASNMPLLSRSGQAKPLVAVVIN